MRKELGDCEQLGRLAFNEFLSGMGLRYTFVQGRVKLAQLPANVEQVVLTGGAAIVAAAKGLSITTPLALLTAMSMLGVIPQAGDFVTPENLISPAETAILDAADRAKRDAKKKCYKNVRRKYGI